MSVEGGWGTSRNSRCRGETLLETKDLTVKFGGLVALDSVTFNIRRGEILGMIGPNGAGKTTCFNAITGVYRPTSGSVVFDGAPLGRIGAVRSPAAALPARSRTSGCGAR